MRVHRIRRVQLVLAVWLLILAVLTLISWRLLSVPRIVGKVRLVDIKHTESGWHVKVVTDLRDNTHEHTVHRDPRGETGRGESENRGPAISFMSLLRPFPVHSETEFVFSAEDGEVFTHVPPGEDVKLTDGKELTLVSSSRSGEQMRSVTIRVENIPPEP